jgi:voltage-gated potassium channel
VKASVRATVLAGVDSHDGARAIQAWRWMQWTLLVVSLLAIPAFYLELADASGLRLAGRMLYACMCAGFVAILARMAALSKPHLFLTLVSVRRSGSPCLACCRL